MKKFKIILMTLLIFGALSINASNDPVSENLIVSIKNNTSENSFTLQIANLQQLDTKISLYNEEGRELHQRKVIYSSELQFKYVLKDFPDGYYTLEIDWNKVTKTWAIYKEGNRLEFEMEDSRTQDGVWLVQN